LYTDRQGCPRLPAIFQTLFRCFKEMVETAVRLPSSLSIGEFHVVNIQTLIDDAKCYEVVRQLRWPTGIQCPACGASEIVKRGHHTHQAHR